MQLIVENAMPKKVQKKSDSWFFLFLKPKENEEGGEGKLSVSLPSFPVYFGGKNGLPISLKGSGQKSEPPDQHAARKTEHMVTRCWTYSVQWQKSVLARWT